MYEPELVYKIRGVVFDIYNNIVGDWSEEVYEDILFDALIADGLSVDRQKEFEVFYKDNRVGLYRTDLIINDKIILELKVVPEVYALHQAQTISYLKVTGLPLGILINFGGKELFIKSFPNNMNYTNYCLKESDCSFLRCLDTNFDINKINLPCDDKKLICPYLMISKEILEILGPGYFHQVYRRAFWDELRMREIEFKLIKSLQLTYRDKVYGEKEVRFFKINGLLISIVAVNKLDDLRLHKLFGFIKHYGCEKGLIINFKNTIVDFRYVNILHSFKQ